MEKVIKKIGKEIKIMVINIIVVERIVIIISITKQKLKKISGLIKEILIQLNIII